MDEQATVTIYEPPVLVELGKFSENTLGDGEDLADMAAQEDDDDGGLPF